MNSEALATFKASYPFQFDEYQGQALEALASGESVLVAAPTGSGKTVVGEFAVHLALAQRGKAFYTTPLKALSNQKFGDFQAIYGTGNVGLLTGDNSIAPTAPVVVMTTEVLRNMIYERSELLDDLRYVVLDEVHYLQDPYRGAVWEEVIIHLPVDVRIVSLSATVSNAEEFAEWIQTLRGTTAAVIETHRPVELRHHYLLDSLLMPMFTGEGDDRQPNPEVRRMEGRLSRPVRHPRGRRRGRGRRRRYPNRPNRAQVIEVLEANSMLPAIYFIFSRKGCDAAVAQCLREGLRLVAPSDRPRIVEIAQMRCAYLDEDDLEVLGYRQWLAGLEAGVASHHAGLIPAFKETVEELFQKGLLRAVFATETLSLGINMPARSVVIERLMKFTGDHHEVMTPGEFAQLTGRAGRRGIDTMGHAVVLRQDDLNFSQVAGMASARTYTLESSFQPSYNMAGNLVRNYSREEAEHLLNSSFGQFRVDKEVVVFEKLIERNDAYLASYREKMACDRGEFSVYWQLREELGLRERAGQSMGRIRGALETARVGQVYLLGSGAARSRAVVIGKQRSKKGEPRVVVVTDDARSVKLGPRNFDAPPQPVDNLAARREGQSLFRRWWEGESSHLDSKTRRSIARALRELTIEKLPEPSLEEDLEVAEARARLQQHPCHGCPDRDRHAQWAKRAARLERENDDLHKRVGARSHTLSRTFERVLAILEEFGYVEGFELTKKGWILTHIYGENDLLVAESLLRGWLDGLDAASLAAVVSTFVYESRGPFQSPGSMPTGATKKTYSRLANLAKRVQGKERRAGLALTRGVEAGFAGVAYRWCRDTELEDILDEDLTAGDFIRNAKQTIDLLRQLFQVAEDVPGLSTNLTDAIDSMNRGVVSYTGII